MSFYGIISCSNWLLSDRSPESINKNPIKNFEEKILIFYLKILDFHHFPFMFCMNKHGLFGPSFISAQDNQVHLRIFQEENMTSWLEGEEYEDQAIFAL